MLQLALSALDRLEVRGRDSAGLHVLVRDHGLDLDDPTVRRMVAERIADPLFCGGAVRVVDGRLSFVYKTAAEIGELGDNTAALRTQIRNDELLRLAVRSDESGALVLGHTRWASVGIISEANAHPLNSDELMPLGARARRAQAAHLAHEAPRRRAGVDKPLGARARQGGERRPPTWPTRLRGGERGWTSPWGREPDERRPPTWPTRLRGGERGWKRRQARTSSPRTSLPR